MKELKKLSHRHSTCQGSPRATCSSLNSDVRKHALLYSLQLLTQSVNPSLHVFVPAAATGLRDAFAAQLLGGRARERERYVASLTSPLH